MAGDKYQLFLATVLDQGFLEIHPVDTRHLHIHDHARRAAVRWTRQEIGRRFKNLALIPGGAEQSRQTFSHRRIVVDRKNQTLWRHHHPTAAPAGRVKWKRAPPPSTFSPVTVPPCDSTIERTIPRPIPNPSAFVVKK